MKGGLDCVLHWSAASSQRRPYQRNGSSLIALMRPDYTTSSLQCSTRRESRDWPDISGFYQSRITRRNYQYAIS
jgi:hypothetical protein